MENNFFDHKRKYPRKIFKKPVSYVCRGFTEVATGVEIGEGGLSFESEMALTENDQMVVNFFVPGGEFFSLRATIRSCTKKSEGRLVYGLSFNEVGLTLKRQIRAYVARISVQQPH